MFLLLISYVKFHIDFQKLSERSGGFYMVFSNYLFWTSCQTLKECVMLADKKKDLIRRIIFSDTEAMLVYNTKACEIIRRFAPYFLVQSRFLFG